MGNNVKPVGADSISALTNVNNKMNKNPVGADSISAYNVDSKNIYISKRADTGSAPTRNESFDHDNIQRAEMESQRAEIDSAPTGKYKYNRRSLRLSHYDYSRAGYYFITITAQNREHLFGEIVDGKMVLNVAGRMVERLWYEIANDFKNVRLHEFVIMPNHIHGIIEITYQNPVGAESISAHTNPNYKINQNPVGADTGSAPTQYKYNNHVFKPKRAEMDSQRAEMDSQRAEIDSAPTLSKIVQSFKRHTTLQYIQMVKNGKLPPFNKRIWQRNFYEHVIRDANDYARIAEYIVNNPLSWELDILNKP